MDAVKKVLALRILDMLLYTDILHCAEGGRRKTVLNHIHAVVATGQGGLALRRLNNIFQRSSARGSHRPAAAACAVRVNSGRRRRLLGKIPAERVPTGQAEDGQRQGQGHSAEQQRRPWVEDGQAGEDAGAGVSAAALSKKD